MKENDRDVVTLKKRLEERKQTWEAIEPVLRPISWEQYFMGMAIITGDLRESEAHVNTDEIPGYSVLIEVHIYCPGRCLCRQ